jgi:uncharacterized protein YegL
MTDYSEIIVLIDRSGSMATLAPEMVKGLDFFLTEQKKNPAPCKVTIGQFDSMTIDTVEFPTKHKWLQDCATPKLDARGGTPLIDAVCLTIDKIGADFATMTDPPSRVIMVIITDGEENQSHLYSKAEAVNRIKHQESQYKWQFIYLGANVDAFAEAGSLGISLQNAVNYGANAGGVQAAYMAASASTMRGRNDMSVSFTAGEVKLTADTVDKP